MTALGTALQKAVESDTPVTRLHEHASYDPADFEVPTGREEEWRFTPLRRLRGLAGADPLPAGAVTVEVEPAPEVKAEKAQRGDPRIGASYVPTDRVSARAFASFTEATVITVPAEAETTAPTMITVHGEGTDGVAFGHTVVEVGPMARTTVVLDHRGSATYADNVELVVADGAALSVVSLQDWADDAVHLSHHHVQLGRDAKVSHTVVTLGGDLVRIVPSVTYTGRGGDAELNGLYITDAGQHQEHRLFVEHSAPDCKSRVLYKGALQGDEAHSVWIGDVLIEVSATGTDTYEYNRNLVLTDNARADSVPNLEILTGEILGAGHASANGRLEDIHLFYLMARGIPYEEARRLVIRGYFGELLDKIEVGDVRERVAQAVEAELG
ncbi:MAG: Fe-S cluster assembly protein SufD [Actinobacteria bacterium]|nr:Fe-S cluster assembly protein SufD [Actinomycetota bacterium]